MKYKRQGQILMILHEQNIKTHGQLLKALKEKGIEATQATVSRDMRELGVVKVPVPEGGCVYSASNDVVRDVERRIEMMSETVTAIDYTSNCIIVKTYPEMASSVASGIESLKIADFVGTMAVNDTIFIMCRDGENVEEVAEKLSIMFNI